MCPLWVGVNNIEQCFAGNIIRLMLILSMLQPYCSALFGPNLSEGNIVDDIEHESRKSV